MCSLPAGPGPCRAAIPRFAWEAAAGACREFLWGGCGAEWPGANNFMSLAQCSLACSTAGGGGGTAAGGDPAAEDVVVIRPLPADSVPNLPLQGPLPVEVRPALQLQAGAVASAANLTGRDGVQPYAIALMCLCLAAAVM